MSDVMPGPRGPGVLRVAYTFEACWHRPPGGTAVAAVQIARRLVTDPTLCLIGLSAAHRDPPAAGLEPPVTPVTIRLPRPVLYELWSRLDRPRIERRTGPVELVHATAPIPVGTAAPQVVTMHDLAFRHAPEQFPRRGRMLMERALRRSLEVADAVITSSEYSADQLRAAGFGADRVRVVPLGVDVHRPGDDAVAEVRRRFALPSEFVLFVGTLEPRKNLARLTAAVGAADAGLPLVVVGPDGWGDAVPAGTSTTPSGSGRSGDVRFLGRLDPADLAAMYAAASVFAYPSEREGFGLPVLEAMAVGTPVVTSAGSSTGEIAGDAAALVDPFDVDSIAAGIDGALARADELVAAGRARAAHFTWGASATATRRVYTEVTGR